MEKNMENQELIKALLINEKLITEINLKNEKIELLEKDLTKLLTKVEQLKLISNNN